MATTQTLPSATQQLEQTKQKLEQARARNTRVQVQLEASRQQFDEAAAQAKAIYGSADPETLTILVATNEAENTKTVGEFAQAVAQFEQRVAQMESALVDPAAMLVLLAKLEKPKVAIPTPAPALLPLVFDADDI